MNVRYIQVKSGQSLMNIEAEVEGEYAVARTHHDLVVRSKLGYTVFRRIPDEPWQPIVSGLSREVAIAVAMDINKVQQREPEGARWLDFQEILRRYLGSVAL